MNAYEYYRAMHPEIKKDDVEDFLTKYKGSEEEEKDLIKFYKQTKGNIKGLLENIIGSTD